MEADVDAVVAGFITGEESPLSYSSLQGVVGGSEILGVGTITGRFLQQAAHVVNRGLRIGDAVFYAYVIQACKEVGGFGFGAVRECEGLSRGVVSLEDALELGEKCRFEGFVPKVILLFSTSSTLLLERQPAVLAPCLAVPVHPAPPPQL